MHELFVVICLLMRRDIPSDRYRYASRCVSRSVSLPCLRRVLKIKFVVDLFPCVSVSWEFGSIAKNYRRGSVRVRRKKSCSTSDQFGSESSSPATYSTVLVILVGGPIQSYDKHSEARDLWVLESQAAASPYYFSQYTR
jgi:hypothetical protein